MAQLVFSCAEPRRAEVFGLLVGCEGLVSILRSVSCEAGVVGEDKVIRSPVPNSDPWAAGTVHRWEG